MSKQTGIPKQQTIKKSEDKNNSILDVRTLKLFGITKYFTAYIMTHVEKDS